MNVNELKFLFKDQSDDTASGELISNTSFMVYLNEAQRKAARNANLLLESDDIDVLAEQTDYDIDTSIYAINSALLNDGTNFFRLAIADRPELDRIMPVDWRSQVEKPTYLIINKDSTITLARTPDTDYTLTIEYYRYPVKLINGTDTPEISNEHHEMLLEWCWFRAYDKKDADIFEPDRAQKHKRNFFNYFGYEPRANTRKSQYANRPHHNKAVL